MKIERAFEEIVDQVCKYLDPQGYGWAAGDGPTPEEVIGAMIACGWTRAIPHVVPRDHAPRNYSEQRLLLDDSLRDITPYRDVGAETPRAELERALREDRTPAARACTACDHGYPASACSSNCDCGAC